MSALLDAIARDVRAELADAVFGVLDLLDTDALLAWGFRSALVTPPAELLGYCVGVEARDLVLVGPVDPRLAGWLGMELPDLRIRVLPCVESPALALGHRWDTDYTDITTVEKKRETWLAICCEHARLADLQHEIERVEVPAMLTTAKKLELRGVRR